jgi:hypothetical protein
MRKEYQGRSKDLEVRIKQIKEEKNGMVKEIYETRRSKT